MRWVKAHRSSIIFGMSLWVFVMLTANSTFLYGGEKGLLVHGLSPLIEADQLELYGQVTCSFSGALEGMMSLPLAVEGELDKRTKSGQVEVAMPDSMDMEQLTIGKYDRSEGKSHLILNLGEPVEVDLKALDDLFRGLEVEGVNWSELATKYEVEKVLDLDHRRGKMKVQQEMYKVVVDVTQMLEASIDEEVLAELGAFEIIETCEVSALVNGHGALTSFQIELKTPSLHISGWVCVVPL